MSLREPPLPGLDPASSLRDNVALARRLAGQGQLAAAAEVCRRVLVAVPHDVAATAQLAKIARQAGELAAAEQLLRQVLAAVAGSASAELWLQLGLTLRAANRLREAVGAYHEATMADPRLLAAWINLAGVYCELQYWAGAEAMARQALQLAPSRPRRWSIWPKPCTIAAIWPVRLSAWSRRSAASPTGRWPIGIWCLSNCCRATSSTAGNTSNGASGRAA